MTRPSLLSAAALALALALVHAAPAVASSEADCTSAVRTAQRDLERDPAFENRPEGSQDHVRTLLAQAGEAGLEGRYDHCLELVREARGVAGLRTD